MTTSTVALLKELVSLLPDLAAIAEEAGNYVQADHADRLVKRIDAALAQAEGGQS